MAAAVLILLWYLMCYAASGLTSPDAPKTPAVLLKDVEVSVGNRAMLPCDLTLPAPDDAIYLVLWFIEPQKKPIFTFDARGKPLLSGRRWSESDTLGPRADFRVSFQGPGRGHLILDNVTLEDEGFYRCRVDFKNSPARHYRVRLDVIVPPSSVEITDATGRQMKSPLIGPVLEEGHLVLRCRVVGGKPVPQVAWWLNDHRLNSISLNEKLLDAGQNDVTTSPAAPKNLPNPILVEEVRLGPLKRSHLAAQITCTASSGYNVSALRKTLTIDMHLAPVKVEIVRPESKLFVGEKAEIRCNAVGSRPPAYITWWKDNQRLPDSYYTVKDSGNLTVSILSLTPQLEDHGKSLTCRAWNPILDGSALEDFLRMDIQYSPRVTLRLGPTLNASVIKEGDDVYFECSISANPDVTRLLWKHQRNLIAHNPSAGVVMSNQSLVLRGVSQRHNGNYTCTGINIRGEGTSNPVTLTVRYIPVCQQPFTNVAAVERGDLLNLHCHVDSVPPPQRYRWAFNTTRGWKEIVNNSMDSSHPTPSVAWRSEFLRFRPETETDFGHIGCWAANEVGWQREPCIFRLSPAGPPEAPSNCSLLNQTADSLLITCDTAFDGGLRTRFHLQALDAETRVTLTSLNTETAQFWLDGLEPGSTFLVYIYAINNKGRSVPTILPVSTLKEAAKRTVPPTTDALFAGNLLGIIAGAASTAVVLLAGLVVAAVVSCRFRAKRRREQRPSEGNPGHREQQTNLEPTASNGTTTCAGQDLDQDEAQFYHPPIRDLTSPQRWQYTTTKLCSLEYLNSADVPESCV